MIVVAVVVVVVVVVVVEESSIVPKLGHGFFRVALVPSTFHAGGACVARILSFYSGRVIPRYANLIYMETSNKQKKADVCIILFNDT